MLKADGTGALGFPCIHFGAPGVDSHYYLIVKSAYKGGSLPVNSFSVMEQFLKQQKRRKAWCI